jgi:hypothetical protein
MKNFNKSLFCNDVPKIVTIGPAKQRCRSLQTFAFNSFSKNIISCSSLMYVRDHNISFPPSKIPALPMIETDSTFK